MLLYLSLFFTALAIVACIAVVVWLRRPAVPRIALGFGAGCALLLALAAAAPVWQRPQGRNVVVMVDLSPSTRTADFRNRPHLEKRIRQLLGSTPYRIVFFAAVNRSDGAAFAGPQLADLPAEETGFDPPPATAILLFSDGRFALPGTGPPIYPVIDPALDHTQDAAVEQLQIRGGLRGQQVAVVTDNRGAPRTLNVAMESPATNPSPGATTHTASDNAIEIPAGSQIIERPFPPGTDLITARLSGGDPWPENDVLTIQPAAPFASRRWWIARKPPGNVEKQLGPAWEFLSPDALPPDATAYLAPAVIVLDNISPAELSSEQRQRLMQYVRDLGGGLVILGGDHAFAAGGYAGSALESLSPLASAPPRPVMHWILLADSSGSMGESADTGQRAISKWQLAARAMLDLPPKLPPADLVTIGNFASDVNWWSSDRSAAETAKLPLPPPSVTPHGSTNLEAALNAVARETKASSIIGPDGKPIPTQLLLISDLEATIDQPGAIIAAMRAKNIRLSVLAIGAGEGPPAVRQIIDATGGTLLHQSGASQWSSGAEVILQRIMPRRLLNEPIAVTFDAGKIGSPLANRDVSPWNRTWLKTAATQLAAATPPTNISARGSIPMAAVWHVGAGQVVAAAFQANGDETSVLAALVAQRPRDPRLRIAWICADELRIRIDAAEPSGEFLNNLSFSLRLTGADFASASSAARIPQTGPGRYEITVPSPRTATIVTLLRDGTTIDRFPLSDRYAPEFNAIGNDHYALRALAHLTGGQTIDAHDVRPILFRWPPNLWPLISVLSACGSLLLAMGLIWWRVRPGVTN